MSFDSAGAVRTILRYLPQLWSISRIELMKRYSGSLFGGAWIVLHPLLFLSVYLFLYLVIFKVRFPGFSELNYVAYVFSGLVPFLALMEASATGAVCIKQNIHLIKNVVMPIDLIPVRVVMVAMTTQLVGLGLLVLLLALDGSLSWMVVALPLVMLFQAAFLIGLVWILAVFGVLLPDTGYFIGIFMLLLMFVSPIAFQLDMVPRQLQLILTVNPAHYMMEAYRSFLIDGYAVSLRNLAIFSVLSLVTFEAGARFFRRFKGTVVDYE